MAALQVPAMGMTVIEVKRKNEQILAKITTVIASVTTISNGEKPQVTVWTSQKPQEF